VYDALNVLSALDIITKDRNRITFKGYNHLFTPNIQPKKISPELEVIIMSC
jgi:hypothetical protein